MTAIAFIDASYEGDLMARAGVSYVIGRESRTEYNEQDLGGRLATPPRWSCGCNWNLGNISGLTEAGELLPMIQGHPVMSFKSVINRMGVASVRWVPYLGL